MTRLAAPQSWTALEPSNLVLPDGTLEIVLPLRTKSAANARGHWSVHARTAKLERRAVALMLRFAKGPRPEFPAVVSFVRVAPSPLDDDNLRGAMKALRDEIAAWLGVNDRDARIVWQYAQERGPVRTYGVRVRIGAAS